MVEGKTYRPLLVAFVAVAALQVGLLLAWGDPPLQHDEFGYEQTAAAALGWLAGEQPASQLGRLAWHNPGYSVAVTVAGGIGPTATVTRLLQLLAGLLTGLVLFHALRRRVPHSWALAGACVVWLYPSHLFFRLTLWPVALATGLAAVVLLCALRLADAPDDRARQWSLGLALAPLPFFAAPALALLPGLLLWPGPRRGARVAAPMLALWLPWAVAVSSVLGTPSAMDFAGPCNVALGNHPAVEPGRGSVWGDRHARERFQIDQRGACAQTDLAERTRCDARWCGEVARRTVRQDPAGASLRAALRVAETWSQDSFLLRHLDELDRPAPPGMAAVVLLLHVALLLLAVTGLRTREGRAAWVAVALWTLPVLMTVGFTRLRQPLLPVLVFAAVVGLADLLAREQARG